MHVLNVNFSLDSRLGGGTAERTFQMSRYLAMTGAQCTVLTIDSGLDSERIASLAPAKVFALKPLWKRYYVPRLDWQLIRRLVDQADVIHLMGHWSVINAFVYIAVRLAGKPYVVCPAGALPLFGRSALLKRFYNLIVGKAIIRNATAWIAVTASEFPQFSTYGIDQSQIQVIANGVAEDSFLLSDIHAFRKNYMLPDAPVILFMGRLNLIKGPDLLLEAFGSVKDHLPSWHLVLAGPDEGMQQQLLSIAARLEISDRVHFLGFVGGQAKAAAYHLAKLLVVPSRQEAMSIVALEAGICGTPVMVSDQCGFGEVCEIDPNLETPATISGLAEGLLYLTADLDRLDRLASEFKDFVARRYAWSSLVVSYFDLYKGILALSGRNDFCEPSDRRV
ncbi:MAG TPA: glycosyltransferase [Azonexus sp.]|nr:glycosyltransferase [Azonexus sp.]